MASASSMPPTLRIRRSAQRRIESGHVWVFSNEVAGKIADYRAGQLVSVVGERGRRFGTGYVNPNALIAVRLLDPGGGPIDAAFFRRRFDAARAWRQRLYPELKTLRLVHGEADGLSGLVVDRYEDHLAVEVLTAGMEALQPIWLPVLEEMFRPRAVIARNDTSVREYENLPRAVTVLSGSPAESVEVEELGVRYAVDPLSGEETGLFLDRKENRVRLTRWAKDADVLDAFCYVGSWALRAGLAGAQSVLGVESSEQAVSRARQNAELNGVSDRVHFETGDVLDVFQRMIAEGRQFDVVIADPPALAKRKSHAKDASKGYRQINIQAMRLVRPDGILVSCSCSRHISAEDFRNILVQAGRATERKLHLIEQCGAAPDHPVLLSMRETEYLTCVFARVGG